MPNPNFSIEYLSQLAFQSLLSAPDSPVSVKNIYCQDRPEARVSPCIIISTQTKQRDLGFGGPGGNNSGIYDVMTTIVLEEEANEKQLTGNAQSVILEPGALSAQRWAEISECLIYNTTDLAYRLTNAVVEPFEVYNQSAVIDTSLASVEADIRSWKKTLIINMVARVGRVS